MLSPATLHYLRNDCSVLLFVICLGFFNRLTLPVGCQQRPRDIHHGGKYDRRKSYGCNFSHFFSETRSQTAVLHTHFNGYGSTIPLIHSKQAACPIAQSVSR